METKFYTFAQNNSGGVFDFQEASGITHFVIVEANDETHAMARALDIGLYFNGCDSGMDCSCCGDRWSDYIQGTSQPMVYGELATEYGKTDELGITTQWMPDGQEICIHYLDGRKDWHGVINPKRRHPFRKVSP